MTDQEPGATPAIELRGIGKRFPGVVANDDVNLAILPGEVHAIVGENGAGKSTLMKILYGMQRPDEGEIRVAGEPVAFRSPKDAIAAGIGMVHQHFMLAGNLTVLENVVLGAEPRRFGALDWSEARWRLDAMARAHDTPLDPDRTVDSLSVGEKQRVEILKVLYRGARVLILDEPTGVLVPQEVDALFATLRELKAQGVTIAFISHKLHEVLAIADRVTVMRAGRTVTTVDAGSVTTGELAELMVGSELPSPSTRTTHVTDVPELEVAGLGARGEGDRWLVEGIDLSVRRGEIAGVAGVEGNGQAELVELLLGLRHADAGTIRLGGEDVTAWPTRRRREAGMGYVPEDRHARGLLLSAPLWENVMLGRQGAEPFAHRGILRPKAARERTREVIERFDVRTPGEHVAAHALSGGNQQKLIMGREILGLPKLLIAAHPTRGVDVGAQAAIWEEIRNARDAGLAVLLISADLDEIIGLSDRLHVMFRGRLVAELDPDEVTPEVLGSYMTGARGQVGAA
ncbi:MAG TPA: ABC transporter ATP-binding protein [Egibacteraceae bacterium]|nr:ABC transporter ATP-binding protein [Egibacteraceae bacterium]